MNPSPSPSQPAVVLVNLGTPQSPTPRHVRPYLREFLSDRRVVEMHPLLWRPILEACILPFRARASAAKYATIWTEQGSPLMTYTVAQRDAVAARLPDATVRYAMRYGQPAIRDVLDELYDAGHRKILVVPLYPQYAASSAGTVLDEVYRYGLQARDQLELRTIRSFREHPAYISALATAVRQHWDTHGPIDPRDGKLVLSFHGIPQAMHDSGDPYRYECEATSRLLAQELGVDSAAVVTTFQSTFGPAQWLKPATIDTVAKLGKDGIRRVDVVCPGFVSDCLETLEEIDELNRHAYLEAGGQDFHYVPWGNDKQAWTSALTTVISEHLVGWAANQSVSTTTRPA